MIALATWPPGRDREGADAAAGEGTADVHRAPRQGRAETCEQSE